jgi:hypothetical protein
MPIETLVSDLGKDLFSVWQVQHVIMASWTFSIHNAFIRSQYSITYWNDYSSHVYELKSPRVL